MDFHRSQANQIMHHPIPSFFRVSLVTIFATSVVALGNAHVVAAPPKSKSGKAAQLETATAVTTGRVPDRGIQPQALVDPDGTLHFIFLGDDPGAADEYDVHR